MVDVVMSYGSNREEEFDAFPNVEEGTKRKTELPARPSKGKDVKKVRATLLGSGSSSGGKGPEVGSIELPKTVVRHDIEINLSETLVNLIDSMEPNALRELKEGNQSKLKELQGQVDKHAEEKEAWEKEREEWREERKRLETWKATFFCKDVDVADSRFDVNKDVVDNQLISEVETSPEEEA
ncbi:hypothetical protein DEO72_LG5g1323 [Vigna unguiculata]|uniref:Uncharacterized protein n=1 Tax=Vigna unguiculata TaxID=3917 RepID=A0A4D6LY17_VIGUN|nr:hypothetical protein DEO72_LG5g1323 [Vigna unguiculata]